MRHSVFKGTFRESQLYNRIDETAGFYKNEDTFFYLFFFLSSLSLMNPSKVDILLRRPLNNLVVNLRAKIIQLRGKQQIHRNRKNLSLNLPRKKKNTENFRLSIIGMQVLRGKIDTYVGQ